jgi:hypothetical protein
MTLYKEKKMTTKSKCAEVCNELLKGEISAAETYKQALEKFSGESETAQLRKLLVDHQDSIAILNANVVKMGAEPVKSSGAWGGFAQAVQGVSNVLGESAALKSLKQGEEKGKKDYQRALENNDLMPECKEIVRNTLLPRQEAHISTLSHLEQRQ